MNHSDLKNTCHMLILGNFSGRANHDAEPIKQRKIIEVDRDNFYEVFEKLNVSFKSVLSETPITFREYEDMHPDVLYDQLAVFDQFKALKNKLNNPKAFELAAEEIFQWSKKSKAVESEPGVKDEPIKKVTHEIKVQDGKSILDSILSQGSQSYTPEFDVEALIENVVAQYAQPKPDPRLDDLLKTVDDASSELMRKIMHDRAFQDVESAWSGLYFLVRRLETDSKLKLFIADVSQQDIIDDSQVGLDGSGLSKLIVSNRESLGSTPFSLLMHTASFGHSVDDVQALSRLGEVGNLVGAKVIAGVTEKIAGCESLVLTPDFDDWNFEINDELKASWSALRSASFAGNMIAVAPRFLSRMPYGKKTSPIESFDFEELPVTDKHRYYLWSSGAWLVTLLIAQNFSPSSDLLSLNFNEIDGLPLHVYHDDGEPVITPCAEVCLLDRAAGALREQGIVSIRSVKNKDSVVISNLSAINI